MSRPCKHSCRVAGSSRKKWWPRASGSVRCGQNLGNRAHGLAICTHDLPPLERVVVGMGSGFPRRWLRAYLAPLLTFEAGTAITPESEAGLRVHCAGRDGRWRSVLSPGVDQGSAMPGGPATGPARPVPQTPPHFPECARYWSSGQAPVLPMRRSGRCFASGSVTAGTGNARKFRHRSTGNAVRMVFLSRTPGIGRHTGSGWTGPSASRKSRRSTSSRTLS